MPTSATAPTICCCSQTSTRPHRITRRERFRFRAAARSPDFGDITYVFNGGKSRYKALEVKYEWRPNRDLTLFNSLTLSEAKDNAAGSLENQNGNFPAPQDLHNLDADFGLSGYHQPYNLSTSFVWSLPLGKGKRWGGDMSTALDAIAGGWQLAGSNIVTPGEMVTLVYSPTTNFQVSSITNDFWGANNYRPNISCDPYAPKGQQSTTNWFNPSCVSVPTDPSQPFGNAPRNNVRGPNFTQFDLAAIKQVKVSGESRAELRLEVFNLFNRVNFTAPASNRSVATFGTITGTFPRATGSARTEVHLVETRLRAMSYTLVLQCGCVVYVSCDPHTLVAHTRIVERRGPACRVRNHEIGARVYLWEILPERVLSGNEEASETIEWC